MLPCISRRVLFHLGARCRIVVSPAEAVESISTPTVQGGVDGRALFRAQNGLRKASGHSFCSGGEVSCC
jgi:hypothetical protein